MPHADHQARDGLLVLSSWWASGADDVWIRAAGGRSAIERAHRDLDFLGKVAPIDHAVVAALKDTGMPVLDAVGKNPPLTRVERAGEIRSVARWKKLREGSIPDLL